MVEWVSFCVGVIGLVIGVAGLVQAHNQSKARARVETVTRDTLRRLAGDIRVIYSNARWADIHSRKIGYLFTEENPDAKQIKTEALDCARDTAACARLLGFVHSKIQGIQQSLFSDSAETLPDIKSVDVIEAERLITESQKSSGAPKPIIPT